MKKLLLSAVLAMVALTTTFAAQLNPFAYNLYVTEDASTGYPRLHFYLNATAKRVRIYVSDGVNEYLLRNYDDGNDRPAGGYATSLTTQDVENLSLPVGKDLSWRVEVDGTSVTQPTEIEQNYSFWHPHAVAIDNNPMSSHFGRILVVESDPDIPTEGYHSSNKGVGLYAFNAALDPIEDGRVYTGGKDFTRQHNLNGAKGYQPFIVRVSEDSRIFVSSGDARTDGTVVWEIDPDNLDNWSDLIKGNIVPYTNQADATNGVYLVNNSSGTFLAGLNCSMDVKGSGENLKLLLYSTDRRGMTWNVTANYHLHEYIIGTKKSYSGTPAQITHFGQTRYGHQNRHAKVYYDGEYGFWFGGIYSPTTSTDQSHQSVPFAHALKTSTGYTRNPFELGKNEFDGGSGVRVHHCKLTGEEWVIKGVKNKTEPTVNGKINIYTVSRESDGTPILTLKYPIITSSEGKYFNDFAIDYAENLYSVDNNGEKLLAFALPYSGSVSTPAKSTIKITNAKPTYDQTKQLAPFAYNLYKTIEQDGRTKLHFMLNAHARRVVVWIKDKELDTKYTLRDYPTANSEYDFVPYNDDGFGTVITMEDVARLGLQYNKHYTWGVDVYGKNVAAPNCVQSYSFYHPSAVDIDNNPNNFTFGMILSNECMHEIKGLSGTNSEGISFSTYHSYKLGAGIYAFTADFKPIKNARGEDGFNGGIEFTKMRPDNNKYSSYAPRRIRISDDGRIFVTSLNTNGKVLWEVSPNNLDSWTEVISGKQGTTINETVNANNVYIGGPNVGFDVKGSGGDLKLLMLSGIGAFRCHEYDLANATSWNKAPTREFSTTGTKNNYVVNYTGTNVQYDNEGGFWICQYRGTASDDEPSLVHYNSLIVEDYKEKVSYRMGAGIRFNEDFTKVIISGVDEGTNRSQKATIYAVSKNANGKPVLTKELVVDMSHVGNNLNDFAWDYAGNLYACGNSNEKLAVYVMPRKATDVVSTPAREEEMIYFECQPNTTFDVTVATSDAAQGTVEGGGNALPSCEPTTVLAKSNDGYKFVYWKEGDNIVSRDNPYTFDVTHNTQLTAYFEEGAYSVSYWNLFRNGEDIAKESTKFPNTNERLWRLLQNDYYAYCVENDTHGEGLASKLKDRGVIENVRVKFGTSGTVLPETTKLPYKHFVVASSLSNSSAHIDFKDYMLNENGYFNWMAQFIIRHYEDYVGNRTKVDPRNAKAADWLYYPWMIINRTDSVYSMTKLNDGTILSSLALNMVNGEYDTYGMEDSWEKEHMYINWTSFIQGSKPKGWRNWYTHIALGLDSTLSYNDPLPVTWNRYECKTFPLKDESGNSLSSAIYDDLDPSQWHVWTGEPWQYLIWRDGSTDGSVVEHVTRDNMKLYADFGELDIYEDRNNDHTISILERDKNHPTHPRATHSIRVHRPLQAGMYNTICLPFDLDLSNPNQPIKTALEFTGTTPTADGEMIFNFRQVTELQAGMPYLVEPKSEVGYDNVVYGDVVCPQTFEAISHTPEGSAVTFHAVMNPTRLDNYENVYLLVANNRLARSTAAGDMLGMRAYFTVNAPAQMPHKTSIAIEKNAPTASESVQASGECSDARKVMYNERIYIIRDGVTYTIIGARVK